MRVSTFAALTAAASLMAGAANATVYLLQDQGVDVATATGSITTDGATGLLAQTDITGFDITVADPLGSFELTPANSTLILVPGSLSATASGLFFDYASPSGGAFAAISVSSGLNAYCVASTGETCSGAPSNEVIAVDSALYNGPQQTGTVEIAVVGVPEPATWTLMFAGFLGLGAAIRSRRGAEATV